MKIMFIMTPTFKYRTMKTAYTLVYKFSLMYGFKSEQRQNIMLEMLGAIRSSDLFAPYAKYPTRNVGLCSVVQPCKYESFSFPFHA